jgi:hypothetical protein
VQPREADQTSTNTRSSECPLQESARSLDSPRWESAANFLKSDSQSKSAVIFLGENQPAPAIISAGICSDFPRRQAAAAHPVCFVPSIPCSRTSLASRASRRAPRHEDQAAAAGTEGPRANAPRHRHEDQTKSSRHMHEAAVRACKSGPQHTLGFVYSLSNILPICLFSINHLFTPPAN